LLLRLQLLTECEAGVELLGTPGDDDGTGDADRRTGGSDHRSGGRGGTSERQALLARQDWAGRLALLSPSLGGRAPLLAVRRVLFDMCGLSRLALGDLLGHAKMARVGGNFPLAEASLRQCRQLLLAAGDPPEVLLVPEAKLLHAEGQAHKALVLIEPSRHALANAARLARAHQHPQHKARRGGGGGAAAAAGSSFEEEERSVRQLGKRLLYATDWKVEAGLTPHGDHVLGQCVVYTSTVVLPRCSLLGIA